MELGGLALLFGLGFAFLYVLLTVIVSSVWILIKWDKYNGKRVRMWFKIAGYMLVFLPGVVGIAMSFLLDS